MLLQVADRFLELKVALDDLLSRQISLFNKANIGGLELT